MYALRTDELNRYPNRKYVPTKGIVREEMHYCIKKKCISLEVTGLPDRAEGFESD